MACLAGLEKKVKVRANDSNESCRYTHTDTPHGLIIPDISSTNTRISPVNMSFPYEVNLIEKRLNDSLLRDFTGERTGFLQVGDKKWFLTSKYAQEASGYYNMSIRKDDVWIITFPRSGTTWVQELVWLVNNDLDYDTARDCGLMQRCPFLEFDILLHPDVKAEVISKNPNRPDVEKILHLWDTPGYETASEMKSPRHFKSHLPLSLLPPTLLDTCKVVYVARNPKDVAVSYYHHNRLLTVQGYQKDFPTYWEYFKKDLLLYAPYWDHIFEAWDQRNNPNMLFLFYEDLIKDMPANIRKVAKFLGKEYSDKDIDKLSNHLHIDNFKKNISVFPIFDAKGLVRDGEEGFIRNGGIGGSKKYFTEEMSKDADEWIEQKLKNTSLRFPC